MLHSTHIAGNLVRHTIKNAIYVVDFECYTFVKRVFSGLWATTLTGHNKIASQRQFIVWQKVAVGCDIENSLLKISVWCSDLSRRVELAQEIANIRHKQQ
jgi:hypothetical protein